ncbi:Mycothiol-dependent maleylpyruvate isomerase metal-binding domain-containing protein [Frankia sp. AiPs1]|uniref:TIGR03086 family metal-binding protein n=1 Tax=Frankia sp. AiPa1 TaxID=573492 RepID=UPI00202B7A1F|nr:TIGR03086 family metal-binding protein [Frankia sp. AiPa1]MCL9758204.1 TIGR03086 family metal-binding protein [Frankia sp. AiPa1]
MAPKGAALMVSSTLSVTERREWLDWAMDVFDIQVRAVPEDAWDAPTPCRDWNVRALVNHLTVEHLWVPPLLAGLTREDIGRRFDGDQLGADPVARWSATARRSRAAWNRPDVWSANPVLSFGPTPADEYAFQLTADLLLHGWDLARAVDEAGRLPGDSTSARTVGSNRGLVHWVHATLARQIDAWRVVGIFAEPVTVPAYADEWTRLIALSGRSPHWRP